MLTGITLENFKAFKAPQYIPIKPITLVFGPNSAGKSSILHALAFLKYVHSSYGHCDPETVEYGWDKIHLGSWHNLVHGHDATATMKITLHFESCAIMWAFKMCKHGPRLVAFIFYENEIAIASGNNREKCHAIPMIQWSIKLHSSHPFWSVFREELLDLALGERESQKSASEFDAYFNNWIGGSWKKVPDKELSYNTPYRGEMETLFPGLGELFFTHGQNHYWRTDGEYGDEVDPYLNEQNLVRKFLPSETILQQISNFGENLVTATTDQESANLVVDSVLNRRHLHSLISKESIKEMFPKQNDNPVTRPQHVGAFRSAPIFKLTRNTMADKPDLKSWFSLMDGVTIDFINESLGKLKIPYTITIREIQYSAFSPSKFRSSAFGRLKDNCEDPPKVEVGYSDEELVFLDQNNVAHPIRSLGSGFGVILPILVALATENASFLSIEEPESHIHPKLQAELGDIVIESALTGNFVRHGPANRTFIETHSEHLLLRIMRRMRQTAEGTLPDGMPPVRPEDVALLFVSPGPEGSVVQDIGLNERGELIKAWPGGFFEEGFNEMFA